MVPGSQVTFTVDGADANAGARPTYQWQQNGMDLRDGGGVSGTTTNTLTIASVENRNEGTYMCVVTYAAGDVDSNTVQLTVRKYLLINFLCIVCVCVCVCVCVHVCMCMCACVHRCSCVHRCVQ